MTRLEQVLQALITNRKITTEQLKKLTGLTNVSNTIVKLRQQGHKIYTVQNSHGCHYEYVS